MKRLQNAAHTQTSLVDLQNAQLPKTLITGNSQKRSIWTLGHSNKSIEIVQERLRKYAIQRVVDVRSKPYSRWHTQFNRNQLERSLTDAGIKYSWCGNNLGGLLENVDYDKTLRWVYDLAQDENIVLLCSEAPYQKCHRYSMLTPDLEALGAQLVHISYE